MGAIVYQPKVVFLVKKGEKHVAKSPFTHEAPFFAVTSCKPRAVEDNAYSHLIHGACWLAHSATATGTSEQR